MLNLYYHLIFGNKKNLKLLRRLQSASYLHQCAKNSLKTVHVERDYCFNLYTKKTKGSLRNERKWHIILILVSNISLIKKLMFTVKKGIF